MIIRSNSVSVCKRFKIHRFVVAPPNSVTQYSAVSSYPLQGNNIAAVFRLRTSVFTDQLKMVVFLSLIIVMCTRIGIHKHY
jgi:hypothetical protein